jgi:hypothetical protein
MVWRFAVTRCKIIHIIERARREATMLQRRALGREHAAAIIATMEARTVCFMAIEKARTGASDRVVRQWVRRARERTTVALKVHQTWSPPS